MATLFLDYENGNDNYAGTSFDLLASGTDGRISSSTFSSATASFLNDGSLIGQYLSVFNGSVYAVYEITAWVSSTSLTLAQIPGGTPLGNQTVDRQYYIGGRWKTFGSGVGINNSARVVAGDTIRVMGSPAPASIGSATWTSSAVQGTVQPGNNNFTNTTPIVVNRPGHGFSTGDTVVITQVAGNTNANGTWEITVIDSDSFSLDGSSGNGTSTSGSYRLRTNTRAQLASAVTQTVASTGPRSAWTASANVTATLNTSDYKEHQYSDSIAIAAGFTTGKAAYWATGTLDLSGYQQLSFWIKQTAGTVNIASACYIALCSDTTGDTVVDIVNIPDLAALNQWNPIAVDLGAALGNNIQSIAFYVNTDNGAQTFLLNNVIACKASSSDDSLTLSSLISKNISGDGWYGIQSIAGTRVMLDSLVNYLPTNVQVRGYSHSSGTETVTTYKRECIKQGPYNSSGAGGNSNFNKVFSPEAPLIISGGWDRTNMSTQTLETWTDGVNGFGYHLYFPSPQYINIEKMCGARFNTAFNPFATAVDLYDCQASNCNNLFVPQNSSGEFALYNCTSTSCLQFLGTSQRGTKLTLDGFNCLSNHNGLAGQSNGVNLFAKNGVIRNSQNGIAVYSNDVYFTGAAFDDNDSSVYVDTVNKFYFKNCTFNDSVEINYGGTSYAATVYSQNHDNTENNHKIFYRGGLIIADTANRHTASGFSWKFSPTSTVSNNSRYPLRLSLAKVAVAANALVTIKAWIYRDNSDITMRLVCKGGQIAGVASDVTSAVTAVDSWEEQAITFTPTEQGVVEITAEAYGGSTYNGWVDDMTISQAV